MEWWSALRRANEGMRSAFVNNGRSLTTRECSAYAET
jgi:hypothetical protein